MTYDAVRFKAALDEKRKELVRSIRSRSEELIISDSDHDVVDQVQSMGIRDQAVTIMDAMNHAISDIDAALRAIADGSYGVCVECDEPIAPKRLQTIPWASHCIRCQEALENGNHQLEGRSHWSDAA